MWVSQLNTQKRTQGEDWGLLAVPGLPSLNLRSVEMQNKSWSTEELVGFHEEDGKSTSERGSPDGLLGAYKQFWFCSQLCDQ